MNINIWKMLISENTVYSFIRRVFQENDLLIVIVGVCIERFHGY